MEARTRTETLGAFAVLALAAFLLLSPALAGGRVHLPLSPALFYPWRGLRDDVHVLEARANRVAGDTNFIHLPDAAFLARSVREGEVPLWNPWILGGVPFLANALPGALYPPHLLYTLLEPEVAFGWLAFLHLLLHAGGMLLFLRALKLPAGASLLGAAAWTFSALLTARLHLLPGIETLAWLPWLFLGVERAIAGGRGAAPLVAAALGLSMLAGFPQFAILGAAAAALYALSRAAGGLRRDGRAALRGLGAAGAGLLAGALLSAIQVLPSLELADLAPHGARTPADLKADTQDPAALLGLVLPDLLGHPRLHREGILETLLLRPYPGNNHAERALYLGLIPLLLALLPGNLGDRRARFFLLLAAASLWFAFGGPVLSELCRLPGFDFGSPKRAGALAVFGLSVAAAAGAARLAEHPPGRGARRALAAGAWASLALLAAALLLARPLHAAAVEKGVALLGALERRAGIDPLPVEDWRARVGPEISWLALNLGVLGGLGLLSSLALRRARPGVLVALTLLDLGWTGWRAQGFQEKVPGLGDLPALARLRSEPGLWRVMRYRASHLLPPNTASLFGIADAQGYVPLSPRRYEAVADLVEPGMARNVGLEAPRRAASLESPILDLLGVRFLLSREPVASPKWIERHAGEMFVYENPGALPRAFFVPRARRVRDGAEALRVLAEPGFDPRREVVLEEEAPAGGEGSGRALLLEYRPRRISIRVDSSGPGFVVVTDTQVPGWEAEVDGTPAPVLAADHAFRAVAVPGGPCRVELRYRPASFRHGALLSAAGAALFLLLARRRGDPR